MQLKFTQLIVKDKFWFLNSAESLKHVYVKPKSFSHIHTLSLPLSPLNYKLERKLGRKG